MAKVLKENHVESVPVRAQRRQCDRLRRNSTELKLPSAVKRLSRKNPGKMW